MQGSLLLADFLANLSAEDADSADTLYRDSAPVRFVFRQLLPPVAQQFVMRLLFGGNKPFQEAVLRKWAAPDSSEALAVALEALRRFRVLVPFSAPAKNVAVSDVNSGSLQEQMVLNKHFQQRLASHLLLEHRSFNQRVPEKTAVPSAKELHQYAVACWDALLWFLTAGMVRPDDARPSAQVVEVVSRLGLKEAGQLTSAGFRFVLDERQRQLWELVLAFLDHAKAAKQHLGPLRLLFALGEAKVGQCLDFGLQTSAEQCLVALLVDIGVLYCSKVSSGASSAAVHWATPAALAMFRKDASAALSRNIAGTAGELELPAHLYHSHCRKPDRLAESHALVDEQGIIVETNFKVYAYTSSSLHMCLLGLFCKMVTRLPNLVIGHLSAEPALRAMRQGIRVENIIRYLEAAAHPRALKRLEEGSAIVPDNVRGQLEVWESNRSRTTSCRAVLFEWDMGELDAEVYERLRKLAKDDGNLLWARGANSETGSYAQDGLRSLVLAVKAEGAPRIKAILSQQNSVLPVGGLLAAKSRGIKRVRRTDSIGPIII